MPQYAWRAIPDPPEGTFELPGEIITTDDSYGSVRYALIRLDPDGKGADLEDYFLDMEYSELRGWAAPIEGIDGRQSHEDMAAALAEYVETS